MVLAGRSVQQDPWKDSISRKQEIWFHSVNKILLIVLQAMVTMVVMVASWIMLSNTSRQMVVLILKPVILILHRTEHANLVPVMLVPHAQVLYITM